MIIYDQGGVYADSDVMCLRPMADALRPEDGLVAVWEDFNSQAKQFAWDPLPSQVRYRLLDVGCLQKSACWLQAY